MDEKGSSSGYDLTTILAKANTLIYYSSLFKDNNTVNDIKKISEELLNDSYYSSKTLLGTLEQTNGKQYDLILANPPYYQSSLISKDAKIQVFIQKKVKVLRDCSLNGLLSH